HVRMRDGAQDAIHRREQLDERERQRRLRRCGLRRKESARKVTSVFFSAPLEYVDVLAHLLVLEQPTHKLRPRVLPQLLLPGGEQELSFYPKEPRGHLEVFRGLVQLQRPNPLDELLRDASDRDVIDVDLFFPDKREEQIERTGKLRQLDREGAARRLRVTDERRRHCSHRVAVGSTDGRTASMSAVLTTFAGCSQ